jgi:integrase
MADVIKRIWRSGPRKVKRTAWGYTLQVNGRQIRVTRADWTEDDAQKALAAALLGLEPSKAAAPTMTFGQAVEKYLAVKASEGKRSIRDDRYNFARLLAAFGTDTPLAAITASLVSDYKVARMKTTARRDGKQHPIGPTALNRELSNLRHLLHLAVEEWQVLDAVPRIKLLKEPEGRIRWLEPDEEARLLEACRASKAPHLVAAVVVALETGMRKGELIALTWERVDVSRGVIRLEITKSGKRREVPMRQVVYDTLAGKPGPREGRIWPLGMRRPFEQAVEAAGLDDFHFHDCRHHFASWFMMRGGSLAALQKLLGHAKITMTMRYAHLSPDHLRSEMAKTERPVSAQAQHMEAESEAIVS